MLHSMILVHSLKKNETISCLYPSYNWVVVHLLYERVLLKLHISFRGCSKWERRTNVTNLKGSVWKKVLCDPQVTSQPPETLRFFTALVAIAPARGSRAYFPIAPLALERMCRCPQVLGLTQFKTTVALNMFWIQNIFNTLYIKSSCSKYWKPSFVFSNEHSTPMQSHVPQTSPIPSNFNIVSSAFRRQRPTSPKSALLFLFHHLHMQVFNGAKSVRFATAYHPYSIHVFLCSKAFGRRSAKSNSMWCVFCSRKLPVCWLLRK